MNETEKISVIVPVYNAEKFLAPTLDALTAQTYRNLEIILVDDASTDRSAAICAGFAERDPRIVLIRKTVNQGQGAARNDAMRIASGSCIGFCDSDDEPDPGMFAALYGLLRGHDAEIAVCGFRTGKEKPASGRPSVRMLSAEEAALQFLTDDSFGAFSWNKLFRAEVLKRAGEYPPEPELIGYEDIAFVPRVCAGAERIVRTDEPLYYYRQHPASVTCSEFNPRKMNQLNAYERLVPFLLSRFPALAPRIYGKAWFGVMGILNSMFRAGVENREWEALLWSRVREYRRGTSPAMSPRRGKAGLFAFALRFPALYKRLLRLFY